jgi:hypothetical protein
MRNARSFRFGAKSMTRIVRIGPVALLCACGPVDRSSEPLKRTAQELTSTIDTSGYMSTPGGIQVHPSCFHIVPNHTVIDRNRNAIVGGAIDGVTGAVTGGQITETFPPCAHPAVRARAATDSGASFGPFSASWIETSFVTINAPNYFSALVDEFVVPTGSIANSGQELGFFPAL